MNYGINYTFSGLDNFITYKAWGACGNGTVIIRFYANDSIGNLNFEEVIIKENFFCKFG